MTLKGESYVKAWYLHHILDYINMYVGCIEKSIGVQLYLFPEDFIHMFKKRRQLQFPDDILNFIKENYNELANDLVDGWNTKKE